MGASEGLDNPAKLSNKDWNSSSEAQCNLWAPYQEAHAYGQGIKQKLLRVEVQADFLMTIKLWKKKVML